MYWIIYRKNESIPEDMKYPNWQRDKDERQRSPIMYWIQYRRNEPIPEELKYPGW